MLNEYLFPGQMEKAAINNSSKRQGSVVQIYLAFDFEGQLEKNSVAQVNGVVEGTKDSTETEGQVDSHHGVSNNSTNFPMKESR